MGGDDLDPKNFNIPENVHFSVKVKEVRVELVQYLDRGPEPVLCPENFKIDGWTDLAGNPECTLYIEFDAKLTKPKPKVELHVKSGKYKITQNFPLSWLSDVAHAALNPNITIFAETRDSQPRIEIGPI